MTGQHTLLFARPVASLAPGLKAVKVCGIVSPTDAEMVATVSREILPPHVSLLIGMILWPKSRRSVTHATAKEITAVAKAAKATPVAVFVDETVDQMEKTCVRCGIHVAQLHGPSCRSAWASDGAVSNLSWIDVRDVDRAGVVSAHTVPPASGPLWSLFDAKGGGTGEPFDWKKFSPPREPWLLAGGLDPDNINQAVTTLQPAGVDVASGVAGPDKCAKDETRLRLFLHRLVDAYS